MKTYAECEQDIDERVSRLSGEYTKMNPEALRLSFEIGVAKSIATQMMFENEKLRDQSNTAEMNQFLEKLQGK